MPRLVPVTTGLLWQRLTGLVDEVAGAFVRTSFSAVVRENRDLACSLMDAEGQLFAQSSRSIPSFIGTMPRTLAKMLKRIPAQRLQPATCLPGGQARQRHQSRFRRHRATNRPSRKRAV